MVGTSGATTLQPFSFSTSTTVRGLSGKARFVKRADHLIVACIVAGYGATTLRAHAQTLANLVIQDNANLLSLAGLGSITTVSGNVHINDNDALTSLTGLEALTYIGGDLIILGNANGGTLNIGERGAYGHRWLCSGLTSCIPGALPPSAHFSSHRRSWQPFARRRHDPGPGL